MHSLPGSLLMAASRRVPGRHGTEFGALQGNATRPSPVWQGAADLEVGCARNDVGVGHNMAVGVPDGAAACALRHLLHQVQRELVPPAVPNQVPHELRTTAGIPHPWGLLKREGGNGWGREMP